MTFSDEHRAKIRAAHLGKKASPETRAKMRAAHLGKKLGPFSEDHRAHLSAAKLGKPNMKLRGMPKSDVTRAKLSAAKLGVPNLNARGMPKSEAHRAKLRAPKSEAARANMSIAARQSEAARLGRARRKGSDTEPERIVAEVLNRLRIPFAQQYRIEGLRHPFDFALPQLKVLIEIDGCFYHGCPIHRTLPQYREYQARLLATVDKRAAELGWTVAHVWEHDVSIWAKTLAA